MFSKGAKDVSRLRNELEQSNEELDNLKRSLDRAKREVSNFGDKVEIKRQQLAAVRKRINKN
eukprot:UN07677